MPEPKPTPDDAPDDDRTVAVVRCMRVDEADSRLNPATNAYKDKCLECGCAVWVGNETPAMVLKRADEMRVYCTTCPAPNTGELVIPPEQIDELRAMGMADFDIVCALALAKVSGGMVDLDATLARVMAEGLGSGLGREFLTAMTEMTHMMRAHDGRN